MPKILAYLNHTPNIAPTAFVASGAKIIGRVSVGENAGIWYNCVLRGDVDEIIIGSGTNIQDCTVIHSSRFNGKSFVGSNVTIGHSVVVHACTIMDNSFIGMHSTIMDNVVVEPYGFVAAGAVVSPGKLVRSYELWAGVPAKFIRKITQEEIELIDESATHYISLALKHKCAK